MFLLGIRFNFSDASFAIIISLSSILFSSYYSAAIDRNFPRDVVKAWRSFPLFSMLIKPFDSNSLRRLYGSSGGPSDMNLRKRIEGWCYCFGWGVLGKD